MKVIVHDVPVEYQDQGSGPVMLLLHGWQDSLHSFDPLIVDLRKRWRIVSLDLPGFGGTPVLKDAQDLQSYVQFVADFIKKTNLKVEVVVGHSFGGRIIIKGLASGLLTPRKAVLVASGGIAKTAHLRSRIYKGVAKVGKVLTYIPPLVFWRSQLRKQLYQQAGSDYLAAGQLRTVFLKVIQEDLTELARQISIPVLLIWGGKDTETPLEDGKRFSQVIPEAELQTIDSASHYIHQEYPAEVLHFIEEFV